MGKWKDKENTRKLSASEQKRKEQFDSLKTELNRQGYEAKDLTIGMLFANIMAIVLWIPIMLPLLLGYYAVNGGMESSLTLVASILLLPIFLLLIVIHELIHGITWAVFAKGHWKAISFGIMLESLTPYCTCNEPLKKGQYVWGALMPTIVLGLLPAIAAIFMGSWYLFVLSSFMILGGGGDLLIILKLLFSSVRGENVIYIDHPYQAGLVAFVRK